MITSNNNDIMDENSTKLLDMPSNVIKAHTKPVVSVKFSTNGKYLATASADKKCCVVSEGGELLSTFYDENSQGLNDCVWIANDYIVTASDDRQIKVWDFQKGSCLMTMKEVSSAGEGASFCLDVNRMNHVIYGGGYDGSVTLYDTSQQASVMTFAAHSDPVASISCSPNGIDFATGGNDGLVRIWDSRFISCCKYTMGAYCNPAVSSVKYSGLGDFLLITSLGSDHCLFSFDKGLPKYCRSYGGHANKRYMLHSCFYVNPEGQPCIVSGSENGQVHMWDVNTGNTTTRFQAASGIVFSVASNPGISNPYQLITSAADGSVSIWDPSNVSRNTNLAMS